jgi:DNA-binding response OmpR family regulator
MIGLETEKRFALHVDDHDERQGYMWEHLQSLGFKLHHAPDPEAAWDMIRQNPYRLVLMQMETMGGEIYPFCSEMREIDPHAILIALMKKFSVSIEERLFECGINDVVSGQHASARVLMKRIQAHLINTGWGLPQKTVQIGDAVFDYERREISRCGVVYALPGMLADVLKYFVDNANRVISRDELKASPLWSDSICAGPEDGGKTFDVHVSRLRRIIEADPLKPEIIASVRGIGWKLAARVVE